MNLEFIADLREQYGLSQSDLGEAVGVTRQTIATWERSEREPSLVQLTRIAKALQTPLDVFLEPPEEGVALLFRADEASALTPAVKGAILKRASDYHAVERELTEITSLPPSAPLDVYEPIRIEHLARQVRDFLGVELAPLGDVITQLEDRGLKVIQVKLPARISGFSAFTETIGAVIVVNDSHPVDRQFFTALHELAHLICHRDDYSAQTTPPPNKTKERIANRLAGAVLLPREVVERELNAYRARWLPLPLLQNIKLRYSVSLRTILMRAEQLGIINKTQCGQQLGQINKAFGTDSEEPKLKRHFEQSTQVFKDQPKTRLERLVFQALSLERITTSRAAEILGWTLPEVRDRFARWSDHGGSAN
jgi:Zn-dependent peptidase ImmA (M78 family)/DNA-binding XRE family transcriptional regulator